MWISTLLSIPPMLFLLDTTRAGSTLFYMMAFLEGFLVSITGPNVRSILQNVTTPSCRGTAFAIFNLTDDLGKGVGPVFVVFLITLCHDDRRKAFNIIIMFWLLCSLLLGLIGILFFIIINAIIIINIIDQYLPLKKMKGLYK